MSEGPPSGSAAPRQRRMTPKGQMTSSGSGPAIAHLPPMMKAMFQANPPIQPKLPLVKRKMPPYSGLASVVEYFEKTKPEPRPEFETPKQRQMRVKKALEEANAAKLEEAIEAWDPHKPSNPDQVTSDAYKTLFVARISYETTERKLKREFEQYGPIKTLRMVTDENGEPRGYAFIEYEREDDMREAYKRGDGRKIDGRRVVVDVERGRTVKKWRPRRLGGGLGSTRKGIKRDDPAGPPSLAPRDDSRRRPDDRGRSADRRGSDRYGGGGSRGGSRAPSGGGDRYGPPSGGDRYGPSGGGDRYGPGGGDRRRPRSRSRSRDRRPRGDSRR